MTSGSATWSLKQRSKRSRSDKSQPSDKTLISLIHLQSSDDSHQHIHSKYCNEVVIKNHRPVYGGEIPIICTNISITPLQTPQHPSNNAVISSILLRRRPHPHTSNNHGPRQKVRRISRFHLQQRRRLAIPQQKPRRLPIQRSNDSRCPRTFHRRTNARLVVPSSRSSFTRVSRI